MMHKILSKTKYLNGIQCPKYLWVLSNDPERIPEPDATTEYIFHQGHIVGELAKKLFPNGINIPADDFMGNIRQTEELLEQRKPLFEAGVLSGRIYSRVDILRPTNRDEWDIIEVKSSTSLKEIDIHDVSFQKHCCESKGLNIGKCFLAFINNQYTRNGEIDPEEFFTIQDITSEVKEYSIGIQGRIDDMFEVIGKTVCPETIIGQHCRDPYECALAECWDFLPEYNIFKLYYGGKKSFDLFNDGIMTVKDIPDSYKLNDKQRIQQACEISGKPHVDREGISNFLGTLQYPLHYLDFETISPAVPLFDGTRPYQAIPFQFSLHIVKDDLSQPEHFSFLASGTDDPRPAFLTNLKKMIGDTGSIVVYNAGFETGVLKELAKPIKTSEIEYKDWRGVSTVITQPVSQHGEWIGGILERIIDLFTPFRSFYYYHSVQKGSASIKNVLPALTGQSYHGMEIADGNTASLAFQKVTYGEVEEGERNKIRAALEKYCSLDTEGMLLIVSRLRELI